MKILIYVVCTGIAAILMTIVKGDQTRPAPVLALVLFVSMSSLAAYLCKKLDDHRKR